MKPGKLIFGCISLLLLTGCEALNPPHPGVDPDYAPTYPTTPDPKELKRVSGGIYSAETVLPLFETPRARHPGDIVTVVLREKTDAKKNATTKGTKNDTDQSVNTTFLGKPISLGGGYSMDFNLSNNRTFTGDASSVQNNELAGSISVTVMKTLSNGNMLIQGEKWIRLNQGNEFVQLSGIIRPQDITPANTISSEKIANARISYGGTGQVNNVNTQGWLSKFMWGPLYPT